MIIENLNKANIFIENESFVSLNKHISNKNYSSIFILVDTNTNEYCSIRLLHNLETNVNIEIIEIEAGEEQKNIEISIQLWDLLINYGADKNSLLINLGGGVITDLGGFIASTFKRGIDFINIPTTLLAMVDASVGGKNGIDLGFLKNQIGTITKPEMIIINPDFLETLPYEQLLSGFSEMLKHALIYDKNHWEELKNIQELNFTDIKDFIPKSISIKLDITEKDPFEKSIRKLLNVGHTLGHAIESYFLENNKHITHGHAIAIGTILESHISYELNKLNLEDYLEIKSILEKYYDYLEFDNISIEKIIDLLKHDKKNSHGKVKFALLNKIGGGEFDVVTDNELIINAFEKYKKK